MDGASALVYYPIGIEIGMDPSVLRNFSCFVAAIEFAMTIQPREDGELEELHKIIAAFLAEYERLYIGNDPDKILRACLCIFQLIHVPLHIQWNGSIRVGSQATVERSIGEMGHKIRSKKAPFANLANLIYEQESRFYPSTTPLSTKMCQLKTIWTKGAPGLKKKTQGRFFFSWSLGGLTNYVIRHMSK